MPKNLIFFFDGTEVSATSENAGSQSNLFQLCANLSERDRDNRYQIAFYTPGLGSRIFGGGLLSRLFGYGIDRQIKQAYINLSSNFEMYDLIYVFGFSRGAIAARGFISLLDNIGILKPEYMSEFSLSWAYHVQDDKYFKRRGSSRDIYERSRNGKFHDYCLVEFLGLFDAVASPYDHKAKSFHQTKLGGKLEDNVSTCVHILSMDDARRHFYPALYKDPDRTDGRLEQIWMPGVHSDIGGTYGNSILESYSILSMIDRTKKNTSLKFESCFIDKTTNQIENNRSTFKINKEFSPWNYVINAVSAATLAPNRKNSFNHSCDYLHPVARYLDGRQVYYKLSTNKPIEDKKTAYKIPVITGREQPEYFTFETQVLNSVPE